MCRRRNEKVGGATRTKPCENAALEKVLAETL